MKWWCGKTCIADSKSEEKKPVQVNWAYASVVATGGNASFFAQPAYLSTLSSLTGGSEKKL